MAHPRLARRCNAHRRTVLAAAAALTSAAFSTVSPAIGQSLSVYGGLTYDASTGNGYKGSFMWPGSLNSSGLAAGPVAKFESGNNVFNRPSTWGPAVGSAIEMQNLGLDIHGTTDLRIAGVNDAGQIGGSIYKYAGGQSKGNRVVRWNSTTGTVTELANLGTDANGVTSTNAIAMNASGQMAGVSNKYVNNVLVDQVAARWEANGSVTELAPPPAWFNGEGDVINSSGQVAGIAGKPGGGGYRTVRWNADGSVLDMQPLSTDSNGSAETRPEAINDAGQIAGFARAYNASGTFIGERSVRWNGTTGAIQQLFDPYSFSGAGRAHAINGTGEVVGYGAFTTNIQRPIRWDDAGTPLSLQVLDPTIGGYNSDAVAINSTGQAVGWVTNNFVARAALWETDGTIIDLNSLIADHDHWQLGQAYCITDNGWISGYAEFDPDGVAGPASSYSRLFVIHATSNWANEAGGSWDAGNNWSNTLAPGTASSTVFDLHSVSGYTVDAAAASHATHLMVATDNVILNIAAGTTLSLPGRLAVAPTHGDNGQLTIHGSLAAASAAIGGTTDPNLGAVKPGGAAVLNIGAGASLTIAGSLLIYDTPGTAVNLSAGGMLSGGIIDASLNPSRLNWTGGTLQLTGNTLYVGPFGALGTLVDLTAGKTLRIRDNAQLIHVEPGGSVQFNGGVLDLTDKKLIVTAGVVGTRNGAIYTDITGKIQSGRNGGNWFGAGIVTSQSQAITSNLTSIGIATASQVKTISATQTANWAGEQVHGSDVLVMYTYAGDANLDGKINVDDYGRIDLNIPLGTGGWFNGDFNYDGKINVDDYGIIDFNVGIQGSPFPTATAAGKDLAAVPEPLSSAGAALFTIAALSSHERRPPRRGRARV